MSSFSASVVIAAVASDEDLGNAQIMCWDVQTGSILPQNVWREAAIQDACLLPSLSNSLMPGYLVSVAPRTSAIHIYSLHKERPLSRWYGHDQIKCVAGSPDGRWLVAGNEVGALYVWDLVTGALHAFLPDAHLRRISKVEFSRDGVVLISASQDGWVKVWSLASLISGSQGAHMKPVLSFGDHKQGVDAFYVGFGSGWRSSRLLTGSSDQSLGLYDLADGALLATFVLPSPPTHVLMDGPETQIFAGCQDGNIYMFDLVGDADELAKASAEASAIGQTLASSRYKMVGNGKAVTGLCWTPDESLLISSDALGKVTFWDPSSRLQTRQLSSSSIVPSGSVRWLQVIPKLALTRKPDQFPPSFPQLRRQISPDQPPCPPFILYPSNVSQDCQEEIRMVDREAKDFDVTEAYEQLKSAHEMLHAAHAALIKATSEAL